MANMGIGEKDQALLDINQAIILKSDEPGYYNHRCIIYTFRAEYDLALKDADKIIELGDAKTGHNNRAIVLESMGDYLSAITEWTKVLEINTNESKAYCRRGILWEKCGNNEKAAADIKRGLKNYKQLTQSLRDQSEKTLQKIEKAQ
jgi:tetratricopeptide (TPR) repeat protein